MSTTDSRWLPIRVAIYMAVCAVMLWLLVHGVIRYDRRMILRENGVLETMQIVLLVLTMVALALRAMWARHSRAFWMLMIVLLMAVCFRELDETFKAYHATIIRKRGPMVAALPVLIYCAVRWRTVLAEAREFLVRSGMMMMVIGVLTVAWAEALGTREVWKSFGWYDSGLAKRLVEEGLEACSYLLVLAGAFEELLAVRRSQGQALPGESFARKEPAFAALKCRPAPPSSTAALPLSAFAVFEA